MIALDPKGTREYVLRADRHLPADQRTVFLLRDLSQRDRVRVLDAHGFADPESGHILAGVGTRTHLAVKAGLVGTRDDAPIRDARGKAVPFERGADGKVADAWLERVPLVALIELGREIMGASQLEEQTVGESVPSPGV